MTLTAGELCAGYGGLALAVEEAFSAKTAWFSEFDAAPSKILKHHWPGVPNHGDMTAIDWAAIEQVDIISGGTPCQDLSHAGRRAGMTEGTRSNLWVNMREAIATQRPKWVGWENVRGAYSAEADSDVEFCPGCMGNKSDCNLRALGRVLGDLSDLGYDTEWRGLRASDVGAPHARFRVFVLARLGFPNASGEGLAFPWTEGVARRQDASPTATGDHPHATDAIGKPRGEWRQSAPGETSSRQSSAFHTGRSGARPVADAESIGRREGRTEPEGIEWGPNDAIGGSEDLPDAICSGRDGRTRKARGESWKRTTPEWGSEGVNWGDYGPAIRRWERVLRRPAPRPTEPTGRDGAERLSPRFTEWMMGLDDGWVTDPAIGISRNEQLKACGNGVVPQQAIAALRDMLAAFAKSLDLAA